MIGDRYFRKFEFMYVHLLSYTNKPRVLLLIIKELPESELLPILVGADCCSVLSKARIVSISNTNFLVQFFATECPV